MFYPGFTQIEGMLSLMQYTAEQQEVLVPSSNYVKNKQLASKLEWGRIEVQNMSSASMQN